VPSTGGTAGESNVGGSSGGGTGGKATNGGGGNGEEGGTTAVVGELTVSVPSIVRVPNTSLGTFDVSIVRNGHQGVFEVVLVGMPEGVVAPTRTILASSDKVTVTAQSMSSSAMGGPYPAKLVVKSLDEPSVQVETALTLYVTGTVGQVDGSFGVNSIAATAISANGNDVPAEATVDAEGRTLIVGSGKNANNVNEAWFARLTANGTLDKTFGGTGKVSNFGNTPSYGQQVLRTDDGLFVWSTATANDAPIRFIRKFNGDGAFDSSFGLGGDLVTVDTGVPAELAAFDSDLLALTSSTPQFIKVKKTGTIDTTYLPPTSVHASVMAVDSQKRVLYGSALGDGFVVGRLTSVGLIDSAFGADGLYKVTLVTGSFSSSVVGLMVDSKDSAFALVQSITGPNEFDTRISLRGITSSGDVISTFGSNGAVNALASNDLAKAYGCFLQPNGKLYVLYGEWTTAKYLLRLARFDTNNGSLDTSFGNAGVLDLSAVSASFVARGMALDENGSRAVIYGTTSAGLALFRVWI
jgi:uncharacterized delta-60 repeat protein